MADDFSDINVVVDVVVPTLFIVSMFVINGFVLHFILRKRREYVDVQQEMGTISVTHTEEPTTSNSASIYPNAAPVAHAEIDEIERL